MTPHMRPPGGSPQDWRYFMDYLTQLHATPLPKATTHDLVYGSIEGGPFRMKEKNDGVVTVESQTDLRVMPATTSFKYLTREHVEILSQPETLSWVTCRAPGR